jgi:uncharacterized protein YkwD
MAPGAASERSANAKRFELAIACLVNVERTRRGLRPLVSNPKLVQVARALSRFEVAHHYMGHYPGGKSPQARARTAGYCSACEVHENTGSGSSISPTAAVHYWMTSTIHRTNILRRSMRSAGVGLAWGQVHGAGGVTISQTFGSR